jgi:hypothetical protein
VTLVLTSFSAGAADPSWERAYTDACKYVRESQGIEVQDRRNVRPDFASDIALVVRLIFAEDAGSTQTGARLQKDLVYQTEHPSSSLLVTAAGTASNNAVVVIKAMLDDGVEWASRWVVAAEKPEHLHRHIVNTLILVIDQRFRTTSAMTADGLVARIVEAELPTSQSTTNPRRRRHFPGRP